MWVTCLVPNGSVAIAMARCVLHLGCSGVIPFLSQMSALESRYEAVALYRQWMYVNLTVDVSVHQATLKYKAPITRRDAKILLLELQVQSQVLSSESVSTLVRATGMQHRLAFL
jgi:hypothetical protein